MAGLPWHVDAAQAVWVTRRLAGDAHPGLVIERVNPGVTAKPRVAAVPFITATTLLGLWLGGPYGSQEP